MRQPNFFFNFLFLFVKFAFSFSFSFYFYFYVFIKVLQMILTFIASKFLVKELMMGKKFKSGVISTKRRQET